MSDVEKRSSLVISLRDQPRQVGSRKEHSFLWQVPEGWSTQVLALPKGTLIPLEVAITSVDEGVYVEVEAEAKLEGLCVRCLEPLTETAFVHVGELFEEAGADDPRRTQNRLDELDHDIEVEGDELDAPNFIDRDTIDLEPVLRDEILGNASLKPLCSKDCLGICEHCGVLLKDAEPGHHHEFLDPRFAALAALLDQNEDAAEDTQADSGK